MKSIFLNVLLYTIVLLTFSCRNIEEDGETTIINDGGSTNEVTTLIGRITENRTLKAAYTYKLSGIVYVTNGAVLTIEPGTKIVGATGTGGGLVITRNAKIIAEGTASKPIVFTSENATPARGDWSGIVILGNAPTNATYNGTAGVGSVEGGINNSDGLGLYGGTNPADNSGILKYVRIEYAGFAFLPDNELNGLTFGGVGNLTTVDYVQVSYANDDSFEWFGGTVNCKHLIAYKGLDDDFDADNGYSGKVQFGIVVRDPQIADVSGSNGFEVDNDASGSVTTPQTLAVFSNITVVGPFRTSTDVVNSLFRNALQLKKNSSVSIFNSVFVGYATGLLVDAGSGTPTDNNFTIVPATTNKMQFQNNIIAGCTTPIKYTASSSAPTGNTTATITSWFTASSNSILTNVSDAGITDAYSSTPNFQPTATSPLLSGAAFTSPKLASGFTSVTYRGAVNSADTWYAGWTKF